MKPAADLSFEEAVRGLMNGDFSRLEPLFVAAPDGARSRILDWHDRGLFAREPAALAEAFTCACFNGCTAVVDHLLARGVAAGADVRESGYPTGDARIDALLARGAAG